MKIIERKKEKSLRSKIMILVLTFLLTLFAVFVVLYVTRMLSLSKMIKETGNKQEIAISSVSNKTVHQIINSSMADQNAMQANIYDDMFSDLKNNVLIIQTYAMQIFRHRDRYSPHAFELPDPANEGTASAQVIYEEGIDYRNSELLPYASHMTNLMISVFSNADSISNCYIGLDDGTFLVVDDHAANKFDENGNLIYFPVRERSWYIETKEKMDVTFSGVIVDKYSNKLCVTCSAPVYADGEFIGVVAADLFLDQIEENVDKSFNEGMFVCVVNDEGEVVFAPEGNGVFKVETQDVAKDLRKSYNRELADFVTLSLKDSTGLEIITVGNKEYYMIGSPMPTIGWAVITVLDKELTEKPAETMLTQYDNINTEAKNMYRTESKIMVVVFLLIVTAIFVVAMITAFLVARKIIKPIEQMSDDLVASAQDGGEPFKMKDVYRTKDEIQVLAENLDDLTKQTIQYIEDITVITKEKERIGAELDIARKIQADMLPSIFPPFPDRNEFDIFASMDPAKEVGGDFYDFFLVDDEHLGIVMADVSGKGVPAALFMMMSKILIKNFALQGLSPAAILEQTNDTICQNNDEEMFVTVWVGILEIATGKIIAANAGHEFPVIRTADGDFEIFKDKHGLVVGGMEGMKYKEYEMTIEKGGTLFVYTDGVPEATSLNEELYGMDRLIEAMNAHKDSDAEQLLIDIRASIDEFVGEAEQFDDLTMLCIKYKGPQ